MKKPLAKKPWKDALSKPLAISATSPERLSKGRASKASRPGSSKAEVRSLPAAEVKDVIALFKKYYPDAHCELHHETPFQLLIATILSAQCTDERVNQVTPHLFARFPSPFEMAKADPEALEALIRSTGFYKNKSRNIKSCSQDLVEKFSGEVPAKMEDLVELAGVGRKTANVVLGNAYGIASGVVVDTHVTRLSNRLGWVETENPEMIERELQKMIPQRDWIQISHWLITHGRRVCKARKPTCDTCFLFEQCPKILKDN